MTIFIAGSIKIKELAPKVIARLDSLMAKGHSVVVGDADGVDLAAQQYLHQNGYSRVAVFCINEPRNNVGNWSVHSIPIPNKRVGRKEFMKKDDAMAKEADYGFMIWDLRSSGTMNNILNLLTFGRSSLVYIQPTDALKAIKSIDDFDHLLSLLSEKDLTAMEKRIGLSKKRAEVLSTASYDTNSQATVVSEEQLDLFLSEESDGRR